MGQASSQAAGAGHSAAKPIGMLVAIIVPFVLTCALSLKIIRPGYRVA